MIGLGPAAPQIDHGLAIDDHGTRRAQLFFLAEVPDEGVGHGAEPLVIAATQRIAAAARFDHLVQLRLRQALSPVTAEPLRL